MRAKPAALRRLPIKTAFGTGMYTLKHRKPRPCKSALIWGRWFERSDKRRRVGLTTVGPFEVSTVFLGLDHNFARFSPRHRRGVVEDAPVLFESMVFAVGNWKERAETLSKRLAKLRAGDDEDEEEDILRPNLPSSLYQTRYRTWKEAERGHAELVLLLEQGVLPWEDEDDE